MLLHIEAEVIIIATDNDEAGQSARAILSADLEGNFETQHFFPPAKKHKNDPGAMPTSFMKKLWRMTR